MVVRNMVAHLCLTLIIIELKFSVEHDRVVTTLNIIFSVATKLPRKEEKKKEGKMAVDDVMLVCWPLPRKLIVALKVGFACL